MLRAWLALALAGCGAALRPAVTLVCPAQLASSEDYVELAESLSTSYGINAVPIPLRKLDWAGLAPSFFSTAYWKGELRPSGALAWYLSRIDEAVEAADPDAEITILAHSIGGWVARAYISEWCTDATRSRIKRLVTLGTPHNPPPVDTVWSSLDQTRGLLSYLASLPPLPSVDYVSVIGRAVEGGVNGLQPLLALTSYAALCGDARAVGDGIVPLEAAALEGARMVEVECKHADFIPTLAGSLRVPLVWYGSDEVLPEWAPLLAGK